jgi:hypothetical protein
MVVEEEVATSEALQEVDMLAEVVVQAIYHRLSPLAACRLAKVRPSRLSTLYIAPVVLMWCFTGAQKTGSPCLENSCPNDAKGITVNGRAGTAASAAGQHGSISIETFDCERYSTLQA